jgi:hypothetical protein
LQEKCHLFAENWSQIAKNWDENINPSGRIFNAFVPTGKISAGHLERGRKVSA